jgi:hypothetical protein
MFFLVKQVSGQGLEQRESEKTVLYLQIIIMLISYIIIRLLINKNHPSQNRKRNSNLMFFSCFESNLNGEYHSNPVDNDYYRGIIWELWRGDYSLFSARMMIRAQCYKTFYGCKLRLFIMS